MKSFAVVLLACAALAGCQSSHYLDSRTDPFRPSYGQNVIPVHVDIVNPDPRGPDGGVVISDETPGTWIFTAPQTVTQVEHKTGDFDRFSLYNGVPAPTDVPFMTVTVTRDRGTLAEGDPENFKVDNKREYAMNGGIAAEWTGHTKSGAGFCELIVRKPGPQGEKGSICHAVALARNAEEQKLALAILSSIVWKAQ